MLTKTKQKHCKKKLFIPNNVRALFFGKNNEYRCQFRDIYNITCNGRLKNVSRHLSMHSNNMVLNAFPALQDG